MLSTAGAGLLVSSSSRCALLEVGVSERIRSVESVDLPVC